jgi:ABC-type uncharacterized transport system auxiliary subunit
VRRPALAAAVLVTGCLLPAPPPAPRYFTPLGAADDAPPPAPAGSMPQIRLAPVRSPVYLRELMTWRRSNVEYGFYDQRRWAEQPSAYVERALARELFVVQGIPEADAPGAPLLTTDLRGFEEVLAPTHEAVVAIDVTLARAGCVLLRRDVEARRPLDGNDPVAVARGVGDALDEVARTTGDAVRRALQAGGRCGR